MSQRSPDPRSPKAIWDEQFQSLAEEPITWVLKADELIAAFELLIDGGETGAISRSSGPRLSGVAYMLSGLAIENLLKGFLVQKEPPVNPKGGFAIKTHDLLKLAEQASFELRENESLLLERLQQFVTWAGRYPVPLASDPMRPRCQPDGGFSPITYHFADEDWTAVRALIERLKQALPRVKYEQ